MRLRLTVRLRLTGGFAARAIITHPVPWRHAVGVQYCAPPLPPSPISCAGISSKSIEELRTIEFIYMEAVWTPRKANDALRQLENALRQLVLKN